MEISIFFTILTIFCQNGIRAQQTRQNNSPIYDLTRSVNDLISRNISREDFISDVHSAFSLIGGNVTTSTILFETGGDTIEEMEIQALTACKIINKNLDRDINSRLLISWKVKTSTDIDERRTGSSRNNTIFDGCNPTIILNLSYQTGCNDVNDSIDKWKQLLHLYDENQTFVGIGFDESLLKCTNIRELIPLAGIILVNIKFGSTVGTPESFGLLLYRMIMLSRKIEQFATGEHARRQILYFPNSDSVGDDKHRLLLISYGSILKNLNGTKVPMVLPVPSSKNHASTTPQFSIIPNLQYSDRQFNIRNKRVSWSSILLSTGFKRQQTIIMNNGTIELITKNDIKSWEGWLIWNSELKKLNFTHEKRLILPTDIVLDYSLEKSIDWVSVDYNFNIGNNFSEPVRLNCVTPSTILFSVDQAQWPSLKLEVAKRISSKVVVGCVLSGRTLQVLNEFNVTGVVSACQNINVSVYILCATVTLDWAVSHWRYEFIFENKVREQLQFVNRFRKEILAKVPTSKVYLKLNIQETNWQTKPSTEYNSLFCDEVVFNINLYFEGIVNWANLENFPIILTIIENSEMNFFSSWFSLMRRLNYPYPDRLVYHRIVNHTQIQTIGPSFLMQDYMKSSHNWKVDTCLQWTQKRWEMVDNFFHNTKIGTVFNAKGVSKNKSTTEDEFVTMLQYIFYRFRLVEIDISWDFRNVLAAVGHSWEAKHLDFNTEIFFKFKMSAQDSQKDFQVFQSFLTQLEKNKAYGKELLKGLHIELVVSSEMPYEENVFNLSALEPISRIMKLTKLSNLMCGIELPSLEICYKMTEQFILNSSFVSLDLIRSVNYIVCKETNKNLMRANAKSELQSILDSHLVLKRILHQLVPHLQVYFRVELDFEISRNDTILDEYTNLLALLKTFGTAYDISYFLVDSFDNQLNGKKNGWWDIKNYSDLTNAMSYVEKATALRGQPMWYPPPTLSSNNTASGEDSTKVDTVSYVSFSVLLLLLLVLGIFSGLHFKKNRHFSQILSEPEVKEFLNGRVNANTDKDGIEMVLMGKFNQDYKLDLSDITIDIEKKLGSGASGTVFQGLVKDRAAAVKRPTRGCSKSAFLSVLTEVKVLSHIGNHSNVIEFLGAYVKEIQKGVLYIAMELCSSGSLEAFLRKKANVISQASFNQERNVEPESSEMHFYQLCAFAVDIAQGMEYIESRRVVHGDLSTRNVLLDENMVCKIGDFGLSRKLYEYQLIVKNSQEPLPWKWLAYESLAKMEFTSKSDMWSYGVTLWEIYSLGKIPYGGLNWSAAFVNDIKNGLRLAIPDFATSEIYEKMMSCWDLNPEKRPSFTAMATFFKSLSEASYTIIDSVE